MAHLVSGSLAADSVSLALAAMVLNPEPLRQALASTLQAKPPLSSSAGA